MGNTLSKEERLYSKTAIDNLLSKGRFGTTGEIKYCYRTGTGEGQNRIMVSVSKRFFKRAVKRNLLKRRIRESYRTRKELLGSTGIDILFIYNTPEILTSEAIASKVETILQTIGGSL